MTAVKPGLVLIGGTVAVVLAVLHNVLGAVIAVLVLIALCTLRPHNTMYRSFGRAWQRAERDGWRPRAGYDGVHYEVEDNE